MEPVVQNKSREYYLQNKDKWTKDYKKYATCNLCQTTVKRDHYNSSHVKTKKHIKKLQEQFQKQQDLNELEAKIRAKILLELNL